MVILEEVSTRYGILPSVQRSPGNLVQNSIFKIFVNPFFVDAEDFFFTHFSDAK